MLNYTWHRWQWPPVEWLTGTGFDIVHAAHPIRIPSRGAASVVTVHDLDFLRHPERTRGEIRRDYPSLAPRHIRAADAVIAVSAHTAGEIETLCGRPAADITIAPLGRPGWTRRADEPTDGVVLFLGTLEPRKNVGALLDAYARLRATTPATSSVPRLVLAGGHGPGAEALLARAAESDLRAHVDIMGYIAPEAREALYRRAVVVVMPSHTEGFGLPALEAMTVGVPVIAADRGALPEVLGGAGVVYGPTDESALVEALRTVLGDRARRDVLRESGWRRAADFTWASTAARTRDAWARAREAHQRARGGRG
jgi:glycosyltransferase involved in cell wall biosynthesis